MSELRVPLICVLRTERLCNCDLHTVDAIVPLTSAPMMFSAESCVSSPNSLGSVPLKAATRLLLGRSSVAGPSHANVTVEDAL
eukprot:7376900-Prymnesium_polylepis.1